jgi:signal transduction histidine kinase
LRARVQAQIEALAASRRRLVDAAREERRRLASQLQAGAVSELEALRETLERLPSAEAACAELTLALEDLARFGEGLAPVALPAGLRAALEERTRRLPLAVELDVPERRFASDVETALGFVCAEALANVAKHARASRVGLTLSYMGDVVSLDVRDDGVGFDPGARNGHGPREGGFGLTAMRQRVRGLAGTLEIESEPEVGTAVSATVPAVPA